MPVELPGPRAQVKDLEDKLVVSAPSLKVWPFILLFAGWSLMWVLFESVFIVTLATATGSSRLGILVFTLFWTAVGVFFLYNLFWSLVGKEEIQVTTKSIIIGQVIFGIRWSKEYLAEHIQALELARINARDVMSLRWPIAFGSNIGSISFDYGARTIKFAAALDDAEAKQIVAAIQQKYPQYKQ